MIAKFEEFDKTKSTARKLRSFNRAKKWLSNLLKIPFEVHDAHKLRNIDSMMALEHMIDSLAMPGGVTYDEYLVQCLAPVQQCGTQSTSEAEDENFQDATEEPTEAGNEGKKTFKCHSCESQFTNENDLKDHTQSVHQEEKPFECTTCNSKFGKEEDLKNHIASVHEGKKQHECNNCSTTFDDFFDLEYHITCICS